MTIHNAMNPTHIANDRITRAEAQVLNAIDVEALVASLVSMIQVPSVTGTEAESEIQAWQAQQLTELGFEVDHWKFDLEAITAHPEFPDRGPTTGGLRHCRCAWVRWASSSNLAGPRRCRANRRPG